MIRPRTARRCRPSPCSVCAASASSMRAPVAWWCSARCRCARGCDDIQLSLDRLGYAAASTPGRAQAAERCSEIELVEELPAPIVSELYRHLGGNVPVVDSDLAQP